MSRFRKRPGRPAPAPFAVLVVVISACVFATTLFALTPDAPGRPQLARYLEARTTDQYFINCRSAHAAGRSNIPRRDPSYRTRMDRDGDGLACEPYRGL